MLVSNSNYNTLGKVGPHYERPEYRPPERPAADVDGRSQAPSQRGDRSTLSTRNTDAAAKKTAAMPTGKLNLSAAQSLVEDTADLIRALPPQSTSHEPHGRVPSSLMTPLYV